MEDALSNPLHPIPLPLTQPVVDANVALDIKHLPSFLASVVFYLLILL